MNDDDDLCLCFHVTRRKVTQYIRVQRPRRASELAHCFGAGTGCGWCRPYLEKLLQSASPEAEALPPASRYAAERVEYRR